MNKLYPCPYDKATKCSLTESCLGCEQLAEFQRESKNYRNINNGFEINEMDYKRLSPSVRHNFVALINEGRTIACESKHN